MSSHVRQDTSEVGRKVPPESSDLVRPAGTVRWLGKTRRMVVRGGGAVDTAAPTVVENPLQNSTSRRWFALETLCKATLSKRLSQTPAPDGYGRTEYSVPMNGCHLECSSSWQYFSIQLPYGEEW